MYNSNKFSFLGFFIILITFSNCSQIKQGFLSGIGVPAKIGTESSSVNIPEFVLENNSKNPNKLTSSQVSLLEWTKFKDVIVEKKQIVEEEYSPTGKKLFYWTEIAYEPNYAIFTISLKNISDRILSYKGVIITLKINNEEVKTERTEIGNIERCIPYDEININLSTPTNINYQYGDKIKISIYDVPSIIDETGKVTKLDNIIFTLLTKTQTLTHSSSKKWVNY